MAIIKLTKVNSYWSYYENKIKGTESEPIWVKTSKINFFQNGYIYIGQEKIEVKETPEEILALIKEEIGSDNKPCECFMGFDKEWISKEAKDKGLTFKECLFFLYFFNTISITPQDRDFKAGVEMYKKFAKATVKALGLIKEAEKL